MIVFLGTVFTLMVFKCVIYGVWLCVDPEDTQITYTAVNKFTGFCFGVIGLVWSGALLFM